PAYAHPSRSPRTSAWISSAGAMLEHGDRDRNRDRAVDRRAPAPLATQEGHVDRQHALRVGRRASGQLRVAEELPALAFVIDTDARRRRRPTCGAKAAIRAAQLIEEVGGSAEVWIADRLVCPNRMMKDDRRHEDLPRVAVAGIEILPIDVQVPAHAPANAMLVGDVVEPDLQLELVAMLARRWRQRWVGHAVLDAAAGLC